MAGQESSNVAQGLADEALALAQAAGDANVSAETAALLRAALPEASDVG